MSRTIFSTNFLSVKVSVLFAILCFAILAVFGGCSKPTETKKRTVSYGFRREDGSMGDTTKLTPVTFEFSEVKYDLGANGRLITEKDETAMASADKEMKDGNEHVKVKPFPTTAGVFRVYECMGRFSCDRTAHYKDLIDTVQSEKDLTVHQVLVTPSGKKYRLHPEWPGRVLNIFESDDRINFLTYNSIVEWLPDDKLIDRVTTKMPALLRNKVWDGGVIEVSNFSIAPTCLAGFLVPDDDNVWKWVECPLPEEVMAGHEEKDGFISFVGIDAEHARPRMYFSLRTKTFETF